MSMHFDLVDMQLMVNIGTSRSLTRGAEKSHLSLPAASTRVKNLEAHFGAQLLYRTSQGVTMTPAGESLLRHARTVIGQIEHLRGDMQAFALGVRGRVRVLANTSAMTEFMPAVLGRYLSAHPDVHIELRERLSYLVAKEVSEGAADIGIVAGQPPAADVVYLPYRSDRLVLITPPRHSLADQGDIAFADTLSFDYVGLSETSAIHPFLRQAADALGRPLKFRVEVGNFEALCRMVEARVGVGVIPASVAERFARTMAFERVALTDSWAERELHICVRDYAALPAFAQALVDLLVKDGQGA
jgi:DNA-binding transcriptional LysR family regulator